MDPKNILSALKEASPFDLFLVSFFLLPFAFDAWLGVAKKLEFGVTEKFCSLGVVLLAYIVGVVAVLLGSSRARRREIARDQIIQYLTANDFEMMSFERVRKNINKAYDDNFLEGLVNRPGF